MAPIKGVDGPTSELLPYLESGEEAPPAEQGAAPAATRSDEARGPWLMLDARHLPVAERVEPALFPQIFSASGDVLYRAETVERHALRAQGMAEYVVGGLAPSALGLEAPGQRSLMARLFDALGIRAAHGDEERRRRRDFIAAEVEGAQGLTKTNLVVSDQDARRLQAADADSGVRKNCRVVIMVSGAVGGIEGRVGAPGPLVAAQAH